MRDQGLPKLLSWRWAPCAALVAGALSFVGFATLAIPERIGTEAKPSRPSHFLTGALNRGTAAALPESDTTSSEVSEVAAAPARTSAFTRFANRATESFPKRGFTPPLDRPPESAAAPPPALAPAGMLPAPAGVAVPVAPPPTPGADASPAPEVQQQPPPPPAPAPAPAEAAPPAPGSGVIPLAP